MTHDKDTAPSVATNFIRTIIDEDLAQNTNRPRLWCGTPAPYSVQCETGHEDTARIRTRFPPEPNGYLHIGHAKSICLNFGLARDYQGACHMRFDDTNPEKENQEYVDGILDSVKWLGFDWQYQGEKNLYFASSYFDYMYEFAVHLIKTGYAYVDEQTPDEMRERRGTLKEPGVDSPFRNRPIEESLARFEEMRAGKHPEGAMVLRAKINMASPNMNMRDPAIYRIRFAHHHATGDKWCIYPMYTFAHPIEDSLENITHSICTLEFEDQRAFYDWALERIVPLLRTPQFEEAKRELALMQTKLEEARTVAFVKAVLGAKAKLGVSMPEEVALATMIEGWDPEALTTAQIKSVVDAIAQKPELFTPVLQAALSVSHRPNFFLLSHQYEFNRLNLTYVVVSKRKLIALVEGGYVDGWDDPRMPTIVGLRRRGYTPESLQMFCQRIGVSKVSGGWIDYSLLEQSLRDDLENRALRRTAVLDPLKVIIDNYPENESEVLVAENHPQKPEWGTRDLTFSRELWIERSDFEENPPKGYRRLTIPTDGSEAKPVRLRYGYVIVPTSVDKDEAGNVIAVHVKYLPETKSGTDGANSVKCKATIHWVDAKTSVPAEIRVYDRLFSVEHPEEGEGNFLDRLTPDSKKVLMGQVEPALHDAKPDDKFQFERTGYFVADREDFTSDRLVFNFSVGLRDTWQK